MYCVTFGRAGKIYSISMSKFAIPTYGKKRPEKNWTFFFFKFVNAMLACGVSPFLAWGDFHARSLYYP